MDTRVSIAIRGSSFADTEHTKDTHPQAAVCVGVKAFYIRRLWLLSAGPFGRFIGRFARINQDAILRTASGPRADLILRQTHWQGWCPGACPDAGMKQVRAVEAS